MYTVTALAALYTEGLVKRTYKYLCNWSHHVHMPSSFMVDRSVLPPPMMKPSALKRNE